MSILSALQERPTEHRGHKGRGKVAVAEVLVKSEESSEVATASKNDNIVGHVERFGKVRKRGEASYRRHSQVFGPAGKTGR